MKNELAIPAADHELIRSQAQENCPVCGAPGNIMHRNLVDRLFGAPGTWHISVCENGNCRHLWLNPQPLAGDIGRAYSHYYTHQTKDERKATGRFLLSGARRLMLGIIILLTGLRQELKAVRSMHLSGRRPGKLLEIGSGDGAFLQRMASLGWQVEGLDFDPAAVAAAREKYRIHVRAGELIDMQLPDASYDAITMNHAIEHVFKPIELLQECRRLLKPGGLIVCVTPNAGSWGHAHYGAAWRGLEPPRHIHIFTPESLARVAELAGFTKHRVYSTTVNNWVIDSASRRLASAKPGNRALGGKPGPANMLAAFASQAWLSFRNRRRGTIGEECVLVAQREMPDCAPEPVETKVCAVIVIFHPEWDQLLRQLVALRPQVDEAVCVDNSGDSGVQLRLAEIGEQFNIEVITLATNLGIAAGHNAGIEHARLRHASHVLLMDQDSIPAPDMVTRLISAELALARQDIAVAAVGPRVVKVLSESGKASTEYTAADMLISSGTLIRLAVIDRLGAMDETLFIDQVDTEWCLRARAMNYLCYAVNNAQMSHRLGTAQTRWWLWRWHQIPLHSPFRHYFNFRNSVLLYRRDYVAIGWILRDLLRLAKLFAYFGMISKARSRHFPMMVRGILDGLRGVPGNPFPHGLDCGERGVEK